MDPWTVLWIIGGVLIVIARIRESGFVVGPIRSVIPVVGWTIAVGVMIILAMVVSAFGDATQDHYRPQQSSETQY